VTTTNVVADLPQERTWLGHPRGLVILFFAEMWERFSFYGMRGLLIFYLTQHFLFGDAEAAGIYATYGALVYLMPVLGGIVADRYLGFRRAVVWGAVLLCIGHFGMAIEGAPARVVGDTVVRDAWPLQVFYLSTAFIITGVGFLKASISSIVGQLYRENDVRRDTGFTIFYMGINVGAAIAGIACGYLGQTYGWAYGFGLAGVGMLAGLVTFVRGSHLLEGAGEPSDPTRLDGPGWLGVSVRRWLYVGAAASVVIAWMLMQRRAVGGVLLNVAGVAVVAWVLWFSFVKCTVIERHRMLVVLILTMIGVVFWALFEQAGSSLNLFTERNVDRTIGDFTLAAAQTQSFNPIFILLIAPVFSYLWYALGKRGREPSTPTKFGLGVIQVGLGFAVLVYGAREGADDGIVPLVWLVAAYLLHTTGELCLSPVGLSMVTKLSVPRVVGLMMGAWFLSSAFSQYVGGIIAAGASVSETPGEAIDPVASLPIYVDTFAMLAWVAVGVGVVVLVLAPWLRRWMHEDVV
jgi:POT family proton-dependent oligopeptide transporter